MNDRYLYRAKRCDTGEWVEGFYAVARDRKGLTQHNILIADNDLGYFKWIVVDPSTICQCTGLKDKNGKLIWENDILKYEWGGEERIDVIKYEAPIFTYSKSMRWSLYKDEVIGNIFDNPELLEVGE